MINPDFSVTEKAHKVVSEIFGDLDTAMSRAAYFFKNGNEAMHRFFTPMALAAIRKAGLEAPNMEKNEKPISCECDLEEAYTGERRDLVELFDCDSWVGVFALIYNCNRNLPRMIRASIKPGDYVSIPIKLPACKVNGLDFDKIDAIKEAIVVDVSDEKVIFQFDEILFFSAINREDTSKGGFESSDLSAYLNGTFLAAFEPVQEYLTVNKYKKLITLPTRYELFGEGDNKAGNWVDNYQLEYFKKIRNRLRVWDNDMRWSWTSTPVGSTDFSYINDIGVATCTEANTLGGVAPAFCVS